MTVRVLITGTGGQLGHDMAERFSGDDLHGFDHGSLDVGDRSAVLAAVTSIRPDLIVNCAAWTAVDACESDPDRAYRDNALSARHVGEGARLVGAHLCHVSTDYVFDGTKATPYHEWDTPNPTSIYGASKLAGEQAIDPAHTVVRTSWVCGEHGNNMVKTALRLLDQPGDLRFVDDQIGHPSFTADLAVMIRRLVVDRRPGVFHVTNAGAVSWFEFVRAVAEAAGHDPDRVHAVSTADLDPPRPAPRPANSVLDNAALRLSGIEPLRDFHEPLGELLRALRG